MENNNEWMFNLYIGFIQMLDFMLNITQVTNDDLLKELNKQDQMLNEQTNIYLKEILNNQKKIIKLLENMEH